MSSNYNLNQVLPLGILTGSRAFNCATPESDWDIVIFKSNVPNYKESIEYKITDFTYSSYDSSNSYNKPGYDLSQYFDLGDDFIEYDKHTIWGPLSQIIKYWDDEDNCINLFVYENKYSTIMDRFKQLNNLMNFVYNVKLQDKQFRIEAFTQVIKQVGITDLS